MNDYERALIRYVVDGDIRNAQKQAKIILNKIATEKDKKFKEYQLKKLDNKGPELIELPYNLQKIIAAQDVTNFPEGRFLIRPEEQSVVNKLLNTRVAALRLQNSALSRLHYSNRSMYSLLSYHYLFGVDFNPDYQRGSVWDEEDREKLLDSIFAGREIGRFVFKQLPFNRANDDGNYYEIVDGKQRLLTLLAFYENRFPYKGVFYNDLSVLDKNWFMDASIGIAELNQNATRAEVLEVFLALNEGGKPVAKEVLDHARELLKNEANNSEM